MAKSSSTAQINVVSRDVEPESTIGLLPTSTSALEHQCSPLEEPKPIGVPDWSKECSWKDYFATASCLCGFGVAMAVVFVQRWAVHWGQNGQFIWVGLCLTIMSWCTQLFVRRLFLVAAVHFRSSSTLQTLDGIIRSDPFASEASWGSRALIVCMMAAPPALSAAYKSLGGGESSFAADNQSVQVGLTGPPGTQLLGYGLSQFVNATLPWFEQPGLGRTYGFNLYVQDENTTAVLDGPIPEDVQSIQTSLGAGQWIDVTGDVSALVCSLDPDLQYGRAALSDDFESGKVGDSAQMRAWNGYWNKGMYLPNSNNNTNVYYSSYNSTANQRFGDNARHYELTRQTYTATWHITAASIQLESARATDNQPLDDQGFYTNNFMSVLELFMPALAEYDTFFRSAGEPTTAANLHQYETEIRTDATPLAVAVWARSVAWLGVDTWDSSNTLSRRNLSEAQKSTLLYTNQMSINKGAVTMKRDWQIVVVLLINPLMLCVSFLTRVLRWPHSPVGDGFGIVSLLASLNEDCRPLLKGAGLSGRLKRPLTVSVVARELSADQLANVPLNTPKHATGTIMTFLGVPYRNRGERLKRGAIYL